MLATWITRQLVFDGFVNGLTIALIALGLVLVYRCSRVVNFAVGNLGLIGAALVSLACINYGWPFWLAAPVALLVGTAVGAIVELVVVRRLFDAPRVTLLVATIGVAQAAYAVITALPDVRGVARARYPVATGASWSLAGVRVTGAQLSILVVVPIAALGLTVLLDRSVIGRAIRASNDNPDLARTMGISPKVVSTIVWATAGMVSTASMILISGQSGRASGLVDLGPSTMVRALAAAVVGGMVSFRWSLVAGIAIGIGQSLVRFNFIDQTGLVDLLLFAAVVVAVWVRMRREPEPVAPRIRAYIRPVPDELQRLWWVRNLGRLGFGVLFVAAAAVPLVITTPSRLLLYGVIICFAICALSLTVLTGWAGQLSLGQMSLAGLAALTAAAFTRAGVPMFAAVLVATVLAAGFAAAIGAGALRVRGLMLAVITFALALAASQYLYRRDVFTDGQTSAVPFARGSLFGVELSSQRAYYWVVLGALALVLLLAARLRRSGIGRSFIAVRDNPDAAAAYTLSPRRAKTLAFALSGGIAGLGGALLAGALQSVPLTERYFQVDDSLRLVGIAVIGGLEALSGPILGALWVVGLPTFFPDNELVPLFASSLGLLVLLLYVPGGLSMALYRLRDALLTIASRRAPVALSAQRPELPRVHITGDRPLASGGRIALQASAITVSYGGLRALDDVEVIVPGGSIVGLIGANGAGKSTLLNAIGGFVPASGQVELGGVDISTMTSSARARLGLGRTFQSARLFPTLTVRETLLVALEARRRTNVLPTALAWPSAARAERARRSEAADIIDLLGLGRFADTPTAELSTGTRRIVELAGLLALDAKVLCLDEPTAGVAQRETEALGPLLRQVRRELGAAMIVIEHDMPFITAISDHLYCLEAGRVIASGDPEAVRSDPAVIASYLGTDDRAIARSGALV